MKKKFILLAMILLTLIGGVKFNVLNAQEVEIGVSDNNPTGLYPMYGSWYYSESQQIYTESEIGQTGRITEIAFKTSTGNKDHNITVWMLTTSQENLSTAVSYADTDIVFNGVWEVSKAEANEWAPIVLSEPFEYNGGNLVVVMRENGTGGTERFHKYTKSIGASLLYKYSSSASNLLAASYGTPSTYNNLFRIAFEPADDIVPAVPTNFQAEIVDHQSINLTWDVAENALKYQVWQRDEGMIAEIEETEFLVEGLSDNTGYCFTVKSVRYNNTSDASDEVCAVTAELQVPATPANLTATNITHNSVTLTWDAVEYAESYTVSYTGGTMTVTENTCDVTGLTPETDYTFSVTANNIKGSSSAAEVSAKTLEYNDPFAGKLFRIKVMDGSYAGYYLNVNSHDITEPYYWYDPDDAATRVGVLAREESNRQVFTITDNGEGKYYLRDADGYLIKCDDKSNNKGRNTWDVDAYSTTVGTPLWFDYVDGEQFYIRDYDKYLGNGSTANHSTTHNYFKVQDGLVYCDAPIELNENKDEKHMVVLWSVEEVALSAAAAAYNSTIFDDETATLSVTAMYGSGNYTYSWSPANGLSDATSANPTFTPATTGEHTFTCTVTDTESGSTAEASVTVYVNARPALQLTVSANKELIYNDGEPAVLTATVTEGTGYAPYTYSWTLNETEVGTEATYTFSNTTVGEYTLTCKVTDARNNTQTASKTIEVKDVSEKPLEIVLGTDSGSSSSLKDYLPSNVYYKHSLTQQIYMQSELHQSENINITSIAFKAYHSYTRKLDIYLRNTSDEKVGVNSYSYAMQSDELYFSGEVTFKDNDWTVITFNKPFEYDASQNILLCVDDNTGSYISGGSFAIYSSTSQSSCYVYSDGTNYNPLNRLTGVNNGGYKNHIKFGYELIPQNLVATPAQIHVGEKTTLTWSELEDAVSYNIYVDGVLNGNTEELTYGLSDLTYNVEPGHTIEVAAVYADATESGKASVTVQVAGTFTLTVNVTDGTKPIEGATVNIDMAYAYDEFKNQISPVTVEPTDADGKTTVELLRLPNEGFYNDNGNWVYPYYTVEVSKSPYQKQEDYINPGDVVTNGHTMDFVLALPKVSYIQVQDEEGEYLYGDVMEGTNVVLSWVAVEGADEYKVSKLVDGEVESSETITETTYTIEGVWKGYQYAVSALFGELESEKTDANLQVKGNGYFKGYVTDGTKALEGIQVKVSSEYGDASAVATTDAEGYFNGKIVEGDNYILTISHSDYEEFTSETFAIGYKAEYDFETITLTAKPSASDITGVTATLNGENVDVEWTVNETSTYTKYNVYRRLAGTQGKGDNIATEVTTKSTTDAAWETLYPGTYEYGVAALVEPQAQARGTEVIFEEGFETTETNEVPEGWYKISGNWRVTNYSNSGGVLSGSKHLWTQYMEKGDHYLVMPAIAPAGATLSFVYRSAPWSGTYDDLTICYSTSQNGPWTKINDEVYRETSKTQVSIPLDNIEASTVYIAFCMTARYADGIYIDDVVVTREKASLVETQIVWSNEVVKQGPATFIGGDTENPTAWNVDANWSTGSVPADGAEVTINANAVITGAVNVSNVTINADASLTVANGGALTVTGTISQASNYLLVLEEGGQIFQNNANVTARFRMSIDNPKEWSNTSNKDGWQFISMPMTDVAYDWFTGADEEYDLYKYDGSQELEWLNHKAGSFAETEFISGKGYLASLKDNTTATVYGTLNAATSQQWGPYYMYDKDFANLQLIGNPFTFDIKWSDFAISGVYYDSELEEVIDNVPYFVDGYAIVDNNGNYQYYTSADNESIKVGQGFFVKLLATQVSLKYNKTRTITRESNNSLNITATGNAGKDNVVINFAGKSEGFDKLQNFNDAIATVYVAEDGKNYGIYNCDADVQEVELNFNANQMGNYTISIEPNGKFQTVTLVDRFTGVETNMLVEDYNFTAMSSDNHNRFIVRMVNGQQTTDNSHFVYQSGEELILNIQGEVQIVDVLGRVVYKGEAMNDINRINVSSFNSGAYMVKVMNGNEVKVEKVVIY